MFSERSLYVTGSITMSIAWFFTTSLVKLKRLDKTLGGPRIIMKGMIWRAWRSVVIKPVS